MLHLEQVTQAVSAAIGIRDLIQYVSEAAVMGTFAFAWKTNTRVTRMETMMSEPGGVVPTIDPLRRGKLIEHEARLDQHDNDIKRLDRDKEPKHSGYDRRAST
jgi:hypothetical protein